MLLGEYANKAALGSCGGVCSIVIHSHCTSFPQKAIVLDLPYPYDSTE